MLDLFAPHIQRRFPRVVWRDHYAVSGPGHTKTAHGYAETRNGRDTAAWYAAGRLFGMLDEAEGLRILDAIAALQITDETSDLYGCMRWYAEDTKVEDSNAAFFIQMPLASLLTVAPDCVTDAERAKLLDILSLGGHWFDHAAQTGPIHYPNKILSDGAMTLAIARLTDDDALYARGCAFFRRWIRYTDEEGWGWGEHMSIGYVVVIFAALRLAVLSLREPDAAIRADLLRIMDDVVDLHRFFAGHEMTPAIRNYNYGGEEWRPSAIFNLAGVPGLGIADTAGRSGVWDVMTLHLLFDGEFYLDEADRVTRGMTAELPMPRTRVTRVIHDKEAYSYVTPSGSIGSLNHFPVLQDTYQHKTWGLGWQSMPLCAAVYGERLLYARWVVDAADGVHIHPKHCYLSPALFAGDAPYPAVETHCVQSENAVLAHRMMRNVETDARTITDEWYIPAGGAHVPEIRTVGDFTVVEYPTAALILAPLGGGTVERADDADGAIRLTVCRAAAEDGHISLPAIDGGWAAVLHDGALDRRTAAEHAASLRVTVEPAGRAWRATLCDGESVLLTISAER